MHILNKMMGKSYFFFFESSFILTDLACWFVNRKLINMAVLKNKEIICYFVVGDECTDKIGWEKNIQ